MKLNKHLQTLLRRTTPLQRTFLTTRKEYDDLHNASLAPDGKFWLDYAVKNLDWDVPPSFALDSPSENMYQWFPDGKLNVCHQMVDRHVENGRGDRVAIAYESVVGGNTRDITYSELLKDVKAFAAALKTKCQVEKGDRVLIYMPMVPEAMIAMLACSRLGAVHSVVFGGFAAPELAVRIDDATPKVVVSATGGLEGMERIVPYGPLLEGALELAEHKTKHVVFKDRPEVSDKGDAPTPTATDDNGLFIHDWDEFSTHGKNDTTEEDKQCISCSSADPLYILYTSGTTGVPKGILRDCTHPVALSWIMNEFMTTNQNETYWAASDIGWVVGHSFIVYGPLLHGCTTVLFEGKPVGTPDAATFWKVIEKHKVTSLYTAPTALRAIRKEDPALSQARNHDISTLRGIYLAGERADPATIEAYTKELNVPMVDNWWQTETGWPISGLQLHKIGTKPGSCNLPMPGYDVVVLDAETSELLPTNELGSLAIKLPFPPGTMQTLYNNDERYHEAYLKEFPGYYSAGDAGMIDEDGYLSVMARTDDVINTAGHRLSTGQIEEIIGRHPHVAECAVFGANESLKGQVPVGLIVLNAGVEDEAANMVVSDCIQSIRDIIGPVASFKDAIVVPALPKTRSGKILRGVIQKMANGEAYKLPGTIEDTKPVDFCQHGLKTLGYPKEE